MSSIQVKHSYKFPQEQVFEAFLSAQSAQVFMFRTDKGTVVKAEVHPEVGGSFAFIEQRGDVQAGHFGTFVEIEKPERLSFIFSVQSPENEGDFTELNFQKVSGGCEIQLSQELRPEFEEFSGKITKGWAWILERLDQFLTEQQASANQTVTKDSQGNVLLEGDNVKTIKDLKVKGSSMVIKRGTIVRKIHLISGNDEEVDCKVDGVALALETQWLVKV